MNTVMFKAKKPRSNAMIQVITLEYIQARAVECGECWIWKQHCKDDLFPYCRIGGKYQPVRNAAYKALIGPIEPGYQVGVKCKTHNCVNPRHLVARTKSEAAKGYVMKPVTKQRLRVSKQAQSVLLDAEKVADIRASDLTATEIERKYGLSSGYACKIRSGKAWALPITPFSGLGAR